VAPAPAHAGTKHAHKKRARAEVAVAVTSQRPKSKAKVTHARSTSSAPASTGGRQASAVAAKVAKLAPKATPKPAAVKAVKAVKEAKAVRVKATTATPAAKSNAPEAKAPVQEVATVTRQSEIRTPPAVVPSVAPTHNGRGDATLARYMSELAGYELLGRDDEIRLAQEVERLEIAYWRSLLGMPRAIETLEPAIAGKLEEPATEMAAVSKTARSAKAATAAKGTRTRFNKAVDRAAVQLRALDIHREAAKAAHEAAQEFADSPQAGQSPRGGHTKVVDSYLHEIDASRRAQQMAKDRFVAANLRLVVSMARRYAREGRMPLADLIQEGNLGLMKAVERFDHRRGFRFSTYASWWIRHALTRGLADKGRLVRLPVHALETRTRLARAMRKLTCRTGVAPTLAELAAETGLAPEKLTAVEELSTEAPFSLDAPVGGDNDRTFLDMLRYEDQTSAEESVVSESHKESLASLMGELSPFEAQILRYRYGFDGGEERTLKEIGQMYNLSRERIRQIQACALAKMRARVEDADQERAAL
ncbi:MAG: sigma-70 family RNA polymerase sigma factor, partial [Polyangiales bacterium]